MFYKGRKTTLLQTVYGVAARICIPANLSPRQIAKSHKISE
jgi:hypothetical protein